MKYKDASVDDLDVKTKKVLLNNWDSEKKVFNKGLFLTGATGRGKTHTLYAIRHLVKYFGKEASDVENWSELLFELKDKIKTGYVKEFIQDVTGKANVFIDDIGAEKQSDWSQEMLYLIINRVYEAERPLFISTNLTVEEFTEKYGERLVSRLLEMCDMYEMVGEDRRITE